MKIVILSDLHREIWKHWFPDIDYGDPDVVCFLGDIGNGTEPLDYMKEVKTKYDCEILYVVGNHEFYHHQYDTMLVDIKTKAEEFGIRVLDNETVEINGHHFIGATCWTDYEVQPTVPAAMAMVVAKDGINDHRLIEWNMDEMFTPQHALEMNKVSKAFIFDEIDRVGRDKAIVLTHHSPTKLSIASQFMGSPLNGAFCSDWDDLINEQGPRLWAFGHTHSDLDIEIGETRIVARQLGYPGERVQTGQPPFKPLEIVI